MVDYNVVKYCRLCNVRFVVPKSEAKRIYCEKCQEKINQSTEE